MKNIIAFGASNSKHSINKQFATYAANQLTGIDVEILDLNDFEMPIYSIDREKESGIPQLAHDFKAKIKDSDGILISFAEHNGAYSAAYKNIYDWVSRIEQNTWEDKPMLLLSTSPGGRGGKGVLEIAYNSYSFANKNIVGKLSLPGFSQNFDADQGIKDESLHKELTNLLSEFKDKL